MSKGPFSQAAALLATYKAFFSITICNVLSHKHGKKKIFKIYGRDFFFYPLACYSVLSDDNKLLMSSMIEIV